MAHLNNTITITNELRPCYVKEQKALFHTWTEESNVIPPSPLKGGHAGGVVKCAFGIVEFEDGRIEKVYPESIKFVSGKMNEYCFK